MADTSAKAKSVSPKRSATTSPKTPRSPTGQSTQPQEPIQADSDLRDDDIDSVIGSSSNITSTASVSDSIFAYRTLHGRTYNAPKTSEYWAPNDDRQNEGLDLLHNSLMMTMGDKIFLAPIGDNPNRVLDVGTGTGIWAIDFGDIYPSADVIGTDLSPIQPPWVPPNVRFEIDDCLLEWTWPKDHFDFIHMRALYGSIPDWEELYRKAFERLKPGGWLQDCEMDVKVQSDHVYFPEDHIFNEWARLYYEAGEKMGRTFAISCEHTMKETMEKVGFVDVEEVKFKVPCHSWPKDPQLQRAGLLLLAMLDQSLEGFGLYLFTTLFGWTEAEVFVFSAKMRAEIKKKSNCGWISTTVVFGRKPETSET